MKPKATRTDEHSGGADDRDYLDSLITEREAAAFLGLSARFLQNRRTRGGGPPFVRISGRCVRYRRRALIAWSDALSRAHTSEIDAPGGSTPRSARRTRPRGAHAGRPPDPEDEVRS